MSVQKQYTPQTPEDITRERVDELRDSLTRYLNDWRAATDESTYIALGVKEDDIEPLVVEARRIYGELERIQHINDTANNKPSDISMRLVYQRAHRDFDDLYMRSMTRFFSQFTYAALLTK